MILAEPGSPPALVRLAQRVSLAFEELGIKRPMRIPEIASASELPPAANNRSRIVFAKWIDRLAVSNGVNWIRTDTGATL